MYYLNTITGSFILDTDILLEDDLIPSIYRAITSPPDGDFGGYIYDDVNDSWLVRVTEIPLVDTITRRQGLLLLNSLGVLQAVEDAIATLPTQYQIEWQEASTFEKTHPLIIQMATSLGISDLNQFFYQASLL